MTRLSGANAGTRQSGFTLLEVLVAIVLTSVVALLAYGTAGAGIDTSERLAQHRATAEAQLIVRSLLMDALRHTVEGGGTSMNDVLFTIDDAVSSEGLPIDGLMFLSRGVSAPLGGATTWSVTLSPSPDGVRLFAVPAAGSQSPIDAVLPGIRGLQVRALARTADLEWSNQWDAPGRVPAAVAIEFLDAQGTPAAPPLVVHAALEVVR
jgi:prepilin-type N-terminal cleavage/methylation domain-containing protein